MSGGRTRRRLLPLVAVVLWLGCAGHRRPAVDWPESYTPLASLELLRGEAGATVLVDGGLRLRVRYRGERLRAKAVVVAASGGRLYLETTGRQAFVLAADATEVRVLFPDERQWLRAPATRSTIEALVGLPLSPAELAGLLAGVGASVELLTTARATDRGSLVVEGGTLRLGPPEGRIIGGELRGLEFSIDHGRRRVVIEVPARDLELVLDLPPEPAPGGGERPTALFRPEPPADFEELALGRLAQPLLLPIETP